MSFYDKKMGAGLAGTDQNSTDGFDLTGLLLDFLSNWKWFLLCVAICLGYAYYNLRTIIPIYQVSASVYLNDNAVYSKVNAINVSNNDPMTAGAMMPFIDETQIEILKSRNSVIKIVDSLNLAYSYYTVGKLRDVPMYRTNPIVASLDSVSLANLRSPITVIAEKNDDKYEFHIQTSFKGQEENKKVIASKLPITVQLSHGPLTLSESPVGSKLEEPEKIVISNPRSIAAQVAGRLNIEFAENSMEILRVTYNTPLIEQGNDVIRVLVETYNQQILEDKNRSAIQTEAFILDRLIMIAGELRDVENRLQEYRQANNITDLQMQASLNLSQKNNTEEQLAQVSADQSILNDIENTVKQQGTYSTLPVASNDQAINSVIEDYNRTVSQYNRQLESVTPDHPLVQNMEKELMAQKSRILQNISSAKHSLAARRSSIASIGSRSAGELSALPPIDKGLQEIFREQQVKVNIYTFLLQKREEIALEKTLATPTAQLIDNPQGSGPVSPKPGDNYFMALMIGLLIPALVIYLRRLLFPNFKDQNDLERVTSVPILGEISKAEFHDKPIVVGPNVATPVAELFRLLRNNISFTLNGTERNVILVTSSVSGEGKTFIAINLALTYAISDKKVIIIGMDIRRPVMARELGFSNRYGLTTYLSGQTDDLDSLICTSDQSPNLKVLPAGPVPPNPNELLMSNRMGDLMNKLRQEYDYIIIDSAPVGVVSDSYLLVPYSDIQLYVTRASFTTRRALKQLHTALNNGMLNRVYLVLNSVNITSSAYSYRRYGYYGHYGHYNGNYSYGYEQSKVRRRSKKKGFFARLFGSKKK